MSEYALVKSGTVHNVIVADANEAPRQGAGYDAVVLVDGRPDRPGPGWRYDPVVGTFAAPPAPAPPTAPPDRLTSARAAWAASSAANRTDALTAIAIALGLQDPV